MVKQPKGAAIFQILIVAVFTIISGGIVGALVGCAIGLFCSTGGGGGFTPTSDTTCTSSANVCGQTSSGSIADGLCNAVQPSDTQCSCTSPANACGQTVLGNYDASGASCNAATPPNSSCPPPVISSGIGSGFWATPSTIGPNQTTTLNWSATNSTSCSITGDNGFSHTGGASGSATTGTLTQTTTFTLVCEDGTGGPTASRSIKVIIDPHYKEI